MEKKPIMNAPYVWARNAGSHNKKVYIPVKYFNLKKLTHISEPH
jgi:hypothetical protein